MPGCRGQESRSGRAACAGVLVVVAMAAAEEIAYEEGGGEGEDGEGDADARADFGAGGEVVGGGVGGCVSAGWGRSGDGDGAG